MRRQSRAVRIDPRRVVLWACVVLFCASCWLAAAVAVARLVHGNDGPTRGSAMRHIHLPLECGVSVRRGCPHRSVGQGLLSSDRLRSAVELAVGPERGP